jgi:hypothetical protein
VFTSTTPWSTDVAVDAPLLVVELEVDAVWRTNTVLLTPKLPMLTSATAATPSGTR